jgi:hypothetical protein
VQAQKIFGSGVPMTERREVWIGPLQKLQKSIAGF